MGTAGSKFSSGSTFSQQVAASRQLADQILTIFFQRADFLDLLNLSTLERCPTYIFTTAKALMSTFQKLQIQPKLGKEGEILFAPISELSPGLLRKEKPEEIQRAEILKEQKRNEDCMAVAYFYVRIFQIYAALALTIINADPNTDFPPPLGKPVQLTGKPGAPPFIGKQVLKGGASIWTGLDRSFKGLFTASVWKGIEPVIDKIIHKEPNLFFAINLDRSGKNRFIFSYKATDQTIPPTLNAGFILEGKQIEEPLLFQISNPDNSTTLYSLGGVPLLQVKSATLFGTDVISDEQGTDLGNDLDKAFTFKLFEFAKSRYSGSLGASSSISSGPQAFSTFGPSSLPTSSFTGTSPFEAMSEMRKMYEMLSKGRSFDFPKAYAIGRAMTLVKPLFTNSKIKISPYSQVCINKLDFETTPNMPRPNTSPRTSIYFKSLASIFYDSYTIQDRKVKFEMSPVAKTQFEKASQIIAKVHNLQAGKESENFLLSQTYFKLPEMCTQIQGKKIQINNPELLNELQKKVIQPLLNLQIQHTQRVNALFRKMFIVKGNSLQFASILGQGDRETLNRIGLQAGNILLAYYTMAEELYTIGLTIINTAFKTKPSDFSITI